MHFTVPKVVRFVPRPSQKPRILIPRASSEALGGGQLRAASDWKELTDPIHIYATGNRSVRVEVTPLIPLFALKACHRIMEKKYLYTIT